MIAKLVKAGMPTNTIKAAERWREARGAKRIAANGKSANLHGDEPLKGRPQLPRKPVKTDDPLGDSLANAILAADGAFADYEYARVNKLNTRSVRLSEFTKANEGRMKAEKLWREEQERRQILVPKAAITESTRRCMEAVLRLIKKLPGEVGPQCNPTDPLMATTILERKTNEIIEAGRKALLGL